MKEEKTDARTPEQKNVDQLAKSIMMSSGASTSEKTPVSNMLGKESAITNALGVDHKLNDMYNTIAETAKSLVEDLNKEEQKNMDLYATENKQFQKYNKLEAPKPEPKKLSPAAPAVLVSKESESKEQPWYNRLLVSVGDSMQWMFGSKKK